MNFYKYGTVEYEPTADMEKGVHPPNVSSESNIACMCLYAAPAQEQNKLVILNELYEVV